MNKQNPQVFVMEPSHRRVLEQLRLAGSTLLPGPLDTTVIELCLAGLVEPISHRVHRGFHRGSTRWELKLTEAGRRAVAAPVAA